MLALKILPNHQSWTHSINFWTFTRVCQLSTRLLSKMSTSTRKKNPRKSRISWPRANTISSAYSPRHMTLRLKIKTSLIRVPIISHLQVHEKFMSLHRIRLSLTIRFKCCKLWDMKITNNSCLVFLTKISWINKISGRSLAKVLLAPKNLTKWRKNPKSLPNLRQNKIRWSIVHYPSKWANLTISRDRPSSKKMTPGRFQIIGIIWHLISLVNCLCWKLSNKTSPQV